MEIAKNIMQYGSEIWAKTLEVKKRKTHLCRYRERLRYISRRHIIADVCDSRHNQCGSAGGRADRDLEGEITGHFTSLQNGNDDGTMKTEEGEQRYLSRT